MESRPRMTALAAILIVAAPLVAGAAGALATAGAPDFYASLQKPSWAPPPSAFGPVWTTLYVLMATAAFLVWKRYGWTGALALFLIQLVFNALWSWLFFRWRLGPASVADIVVLWILVAATMIGFFRLRPLAGALLVPYLAWVTFAAALNFAIVRANLTL